MAIGAVKTLWEGCVFVMAYLSTWLKVLGDGTLAGRAHCCNVQVPSSSFILLLAARRNRHHTCPIVQRPVDLQWPTSLLRCRLAPVQIMTPSRTLSLASTSDYLHPIGGLLPLVFPRPGNKYSCPNTHGLRGRAQLKSSVVRTKSVF